MKIEWVIKNSMNEIEYVYEGMAVYKPVSVVYILLFDDGVG